MKYIKLFEAFQSVKLSRVLGYCDADSKSKFLAELKKLALKFDFPESQLSDDMFKYLPYKKAVAEKTESEKIDCKATSSEIFKDSGIEDQSCRGGKIKRKWGNTTRKVDCPKCGGSGKLDPDNELKLIKFWFNKDGGYILKTGFDGKRHETSLSSNYTPGITIWSSSRRSEKEKIKHLSKILLQTKSYDKPTLATWYVSRSDFFCIQNEFDGGTPYNNDWEKFGKLSWNVTGNDFYKIQELKEKLGGESDEEDDMTLNFRLDSNFEPEENGNLESDINLADFALVLDLDKIRRVSTTKTTIQKTRAWRKTGSRLEITDQQIKTENLERWLKKLAEKSDLTKDISNAKSYINRLIGGELILFVDESGFDLVWRISEVIKLLSKLIKSGIDDDGQQEYWISKLRDTQYTQFKESSRRAEGIKINLMNIKRALNEKDDGGEYSKIIGGLEKISQKIYQKINQSPFDCIEDLEVVCQRINSMSNLMRREEYNLGKLDNFLSFLDQKSEIAHHLRSFNYLYHNSIVRDSLENILLNLERVYKIVSRL